LFKGIILFISFIIYCSHTRYQHLAGTKSFTFELISLLLGSVDDVDESRLKRSTANEETVDVGLLGELAAVLLVDTSAVEDAGLVSNLVADAAEEVTDSLVDLLGLLSGGNLASANGPDGLVGDDDVGPVGDLGLERLDLGRDKLNGLASLTGLEGLAAAPDDLEAVLSGVLGLGGDDLVRLAEDGSALGVAEDGPVDLTVLELGDGDLASESTVRLVVDVLGGNLDILAESVADEREVEGRRRDNDLSVLVEVSVVEVVDNLLDGRLGAVHLEVAADEELASHDGQLMCSNVIELGVGDEDEKNEKMRLSLGWGRGS
jgi:hypothetical protein